MKKYSIFFLALMILGCAKNDDTPPGSASTPLVGQWSLVKDSIYYDPQAFHGIQSDSVYIGINGDYWNFNADGKLTMKEGVSIDSVNYKSYAYNYVLIDSFGTDINGTYPLDSVTTITSSHIIIQTPGGGYFRMVELTK
jgi:hypothetical protein